LQDYFKKEKDNDDAIGAKIQGMEKYLRRMLAKEGLNDKQVQVVVSLFKNDGYETANIQWTKASRKVAIDNLWQRWNDAMAKLYKEAMAIQDELETEKCSIMERQYQYS
jgi:hypothetical protein